MKKAKRTINRQWHQKNRMPKNPTLEERVAWHIDHAKNCGCREIPEGIKAEIKRRNIRS